MKSVDDNVDADNVESSVQDLVQLHSSDRLNSPETEYTALLFMDNKAKLTFLGESQKTRKFVRVTTKGKDSSSEGSSGKDESATTAVFWSSGMENQYFLRRNDEEETAEEENEGEAAENEGGFLSEAEKGGLVMKLQLACDERWAHAQLGDPLPKKSPKKGGLSKESAAIEWRLPLVFSVVIIWILKC